MSRFLLRTGGRTGQLEVVQEALADLKSMICHKSGNTSEEPSIHRMINVGVVDRLFCVTCSVTCDV